MSRFLAFVTTFTFGLACAIAQDPTDKQPAPEAAPAPAAATEAAPQKNKVVLLRPAGAYQDLAEQSFDPAALLLGGGGGKAKSFFEFVETIEKLAKHEGSTVLLDLTQPVGLNQPQMREVERAMQKVRAAGKKIVCYFENATTVTMQLASQCDRVLMAKMGSVDFKSPSMSVMHYKDALGLLGVEVEMTRVGEFKGAVEPYVRSTMSEGLKKHYAAMLQSMNKVVCESVGKGRKLDPAKVAELQAQRMFTAEEALAAGLVDELVAYEGSKRALELAMGKELGDYELVDAVPKKAKKNKDLLSSLSEMFKAKREDDDDDGYPAIVVLHLSGAIADGSAAAAGSIVSEPSVKEIEALTDDEDVKGVVVRINSPGGSATASEAIRLALERLAAKKPVVFSMGELAASGGYWITCIGQPILAEAATITGSIGVFSMRFQLGALMRRLGVQTDVVGLDAGADMDAMDKPWSDAARNRMQLFVDQIYDQFLGIAAKSRNMTVDSIRAVAGGRVWSGAQAVELGLVDKIGGVEDAIAMVKEKCKPEADIEIRHAPKARDFAQSIFDQMFDARAFAQGDAAALSMIAKLSRLDGLLALLRHAMAQDRPMTVYALMPEDLRVR
jgi:protease-4